MKPRLLLLLSLGCYTLAQGICLKPSIAQVTADGTTNTTVDADGNDFTITGEDSAGSNLFHSFRDFSVPKGGSAFFDNDADIANIFSRVTGGNISNIDGLIRANGAANLFLINPAGIIFGRDARLDIGGSFFGSSADSILFEDGEFSATDLENPPLLTVNAPIGLGFRDNPGDIENKSIGANPDGETNVTGGAVGLQVPDGETLAIVGGNVLLNDGNLTAKGGHIELGSVLGEGQVGITETDIGFILDYDSIDSFGDITLQNTAVVDVTASGEGSINVNAKDLMLENSVIRSGIVPESTLPNAQAGDTTVKLTDSLSLNNFSQIRNSTAGLGNSGNISIDASNQISLDLGLIVTEVSDEGGIGNGGDIDLKTSSLFVKNGSGILADTENQGSAGNIKIDAREEILLEGEGPSFADFETLVPSQITSTVDPIELNVSGEGGFIDITTGSLELKDGGFIRTSTLGLGDAGDLTISAKTVSLDGVDKDGFGSLIASDVNLPEAVGNGGKVEINTDNLLVTNGGRISVSTSGMGNAGNLFVNADNIEINGGENEISTFVVAQVESEAKGQGGNITVGSEQAPVNNLTIANNARISVSTFGMGNAGNLRINTEQLVLDSGGELQAISFSDGNAGNLTINALESIKIFGTQSDGQSPSGIFASAFDGSGNGGNLSISTDKLTIGNKGTVAVSNFQIVFGDRMPLPEGSGAAGVLNIDANSIEVNDGTITAANASGIGGNLTINADSLSLDNNASIEAFTTSETGQGGIINLNLDNSLFLLNNSEISATADSGAMGGIINLNADSIVTFPNQNSDILASAREGQGGEINISTEALFGIEERQQNSLTNDIDASSGVGLDGTVSITTPEVDVLQSVVELPSSVVEPEQTVAQVCEAERGNIARSGLIVKGKGGVPPEPTAPLDSDVILTQQQNPQASYPDIKPIKTSIGDLMLARGVIKTESGEIILTAYPTDNRDRRTPSIKANCI